jgi:uncharacterized protein
MSNERVVQQLVAAGPGSIKCTRVAVMPALRSAFVRQRVGARPLNSGGSRFRTGMRHLLALLVILGVAPLVWADSPEIVQAARLQTQSSVIYDGSYRRIAYPMGDVPASRGVCTDVIIRAYRIIGIDLQALVHEDMSANFGQYPRLWGLSKADSNIDHRRVPNLQKFLERAGAKVSGRNYLPGDLVTWMLPGNLPHIGIVSDRLASTPDRRLVIHNIGAGPTEEDMLFAFPITGHYRYRVQ